MKEENDNVLQRRVASTSVGVLVLLALVSGWTIVFSQSEDEPTPGVVNYGNFNQVFSGLLGSYEADPAGCEVLTAIQQGEYDVAIESLSAELDKAAARRLPWHFSELSATHEIGEISNAFNYRLLLQLLAQALEFKGEYEKSQEILTLLHGFDAPELVWSRIRRGYRVWADDKMGEKRMFPKSEARTSFVSLCDLAMSDRDVVNCAAIDEAIKKVAEFQKQGRVGMRTPIRSDNESEIYALYSLRDQCSRVARPQLHFCYPLDPEKQSDPSKVGEYFSAKNAALAEGTREGYQEFLDFMESVYKRLDHSLENDASLRSTVDRERVDDAMAIFRKLAELPY